MGFRSLGGGNIVLTMVDREVDALRDSRPHHANLRVRVCLRLFRSSQILAVERNTVTP